MWFAFKLVSLNHWIQQILLPTVRENVVICFQISIFEPLNTALAPKIGYDLMLWFAFKLVSLNHWIQLGRVLSTPPGVVICFQISIFEPLNTAYRRPPICTDRLWFAFKLVSLNHWIQHKGDVIKMWIGCDLLSN